MIVTVWRIEKARYAASALSGAGARSTGGRWTSPDRPAIYCAQNLSLAILEVLVHAPHPAERHVARVHFRVRLDSSLIEEAADSRLPPNFSPRTPHAITRGIGDNWLERARRPAISVPSAIVPTERNLIFNPRHSEFVKISWEPPVPIVLDDRLWTVNAAGSAAKGS